MKISPLFKPKLDYSQGELADSVSKVIEALPSSIETKEINKELVSLQLNKKLEHFLIDGPIEPLTEAESFLFEERWQALQENFDTTLSRLSNFKKTISDSILRAKPDYTFHLEIKKKNRVKRALRKLFGSDNPDVSYSQFIELLAAKSQLESEGLADYKKGFGE